MPTRDDTLHAALDAWLDRRFDDAEPVEPLLARFAAAGLDATDVEAMLRAGPVADPPPPCRPGELSRPFALACDHVDHATGVMLYLPRDYDPARAWPLVLVGHGGHAARDLAFGVHAARLGVEPFWREAAEEFGFVLAAPLTDRGWGAIGNSILFSARSAVARACRIDPDAVYVTGHSMGGHLAWRCALNFADRFAAVAPMSGGYDFVTDRSIENAANVPGFATWGTHEPFGLTAANRANRAWLESHGADWAFAECEGGHEIFPGTVPRVAAFFAARRRELYRREVRARGGGPMRLDEADAHPGWPRTHAWREGRAIPTHTYAWIALEPLPAETPRERAVQEVHARLAGDNRIEVTTVHVRRFRIGLHPRMVDFAQPVIVRVDGVEVFRDRVEADLATMLRTVRAFDDRGRVFHAELVIEMPDAGARRGAALA